MIGLGGVAVVSGGSRGLGGRLVERLLKDGAKTATFSRARTEFVDQAESRYPDDFYWEQIDAADTEGVRRFVQVTGERFGGVDLLINNAAQLPPQRLFVTTDAAHITTLIAANLTGPILLTHACVRQMVKRGAGQVINVSSINAIRGFRGVAVYSATKAGLDGLTRSLARELGPMNIRVNSVVPGFFDSELTAAVTNTNRARIQQRTPLGRLASLDEIADAVEFLISQQASFITGQTLVVDGGITC